MGELAEFVNSCEFDTPLYFWVACALILLLIFLPWKGRRRGYAIDLHYWQARVTLKSRRYWLLAVPVVVASVLMAGVLVEPQMVEKQVTHIYGYPVMLVIDVSGSMGAGTNQRSGYQESLEVFNDLITRRGDINFSLLIYSAENYISRYFINKDELFQDTLENKDEIIEISEGTRPTEALATARRFLTENIKGQNKAIIFISDLNINGTARLDFALEVSQIALADIDLYIIATGAEAKRVEVPQISGLRVVDMDDKDAIDKICAEIYQMPTSSIRQEESRLEKSLLPYLILPALGIVALCLVLDETRFQKIP
jgi:hypothetical protein